MGCQCYLNKIDIRKISECNVTKRSNGINCREINSFLRLVKAGFFSTVSICLIWISTECFYCREEKPRNIYQSCGLEGQIGIWRNPKHQPVLHSTFSGTECWQREVEFHKVSHFLKDKGTIEIYCLIL